MNHAVTDTLGRVRQAKFINEGNMYRLIAHSKLPTAEKFEKWILDEVFIRKTGGYVNDDKTFIDTYSPFADENTKLYLKLHYRLFANRVKLLSIRRIRLIL